MPDITALHEGVRLLAGTPQELEEALKARRNAIKVVADERRPLHAQGKLSDVADGIWSKTTVDAVRRLGAVGVQLNGIWAQLPPDWQCPCCKRSKVEIILKSDDGVLIAQAVEHHDHFVGYVNHAFHRDLGKKWSREFPGAMEVQRRLSDGVVGFDRTVICEPCNSAEGRAKAALRRSAEIDTEFLEYFSFAPDEIWRFIRPTRNGRHMIDEGAVLAIFEERRKREVMDFRKKAVDIEAKLLKDGFHWRSPESSAPDAFAVQETYSDAILEFGMEEGGNFSLVLLSATDQDLKVDPDAWIKAAPKREGLVLDREAESFLAIDPTAIQFGPGWRCPCCERSIEATLRRNNKRKLTFQPCSVCPGRGEAAMVCLDCHTSMIKISGSAGSDRDDVTTDNVREVFAFRKNRRHRVRSVDIARAVIEQVRWRSAAVREAEEAELEASRATIDTRRSTMLRSARQRVNRSGLSATY